MTLTEHFDYNLFALSLPFYSLQVERDFRTSVIMSAVTSSRLTVTVSVLLVVLLLSVNEQRFYLYARCSIF